MNTYEVVVRYTITKTYVVDADSPDAAEEWVYSNATSANDDAPEDYKEEILSVEEQ